MGQAVEEGLPVSVIVFLLFFLLSMFVVFFSKFLQHFPLQFQSHPNCCLDVWGSAYTVDSRRLSIGTFPGLRGNMPECLNPVWRLSVDKALE